MEYYTSFKNNESCIDDFQNYDFYLDFSKRINQKLLKNSPKLLHLTLYFFIKTHTKKRMAGIKKKEWLVEV